MFFCEACREKNDWPESFMTSRGPCEMCKNLAICYDVPSKYLPVPKSARIAQLEDKLVDLDSETRKVLRELDSLRADGV